MAKSDIAVRSRVDLLGDWAISLVLLVVMVGAFAVAQAWPPNTRFFPELLSGAGIVLILYKIALLVWGGRRAALPETTDIGQSERRSAAEGEIAIAGGDGDEEGDEDEMHAIFAEADFRTWAGVLAWLALFFVGMHLFGLLITLPVFTIIYLRVVARSSWLTCLLYVAATAGVIYLLFVWFLHLPLPEGTLVDLGL